jgi:P27 family predicted phage terminase small subunit
VSNRPVPTALKLLRGNPGKRAINQDEPQPEAGADMPEGLSDGASKHWPVVAKQLEDARVLTKLDGAALALYCETWARWADANEKVIKLGAVVKSPSGFPIQSPYLAIANKAHDQLVKLLIEFGMTPAARTKVSVAKPAPKKNAFTSLPGGKR